MQRQGDIFFIPINHARKVKEASPILAEGEITGHSHRVETLENVDVFIDDKGRLIVAVKNGVAKVVHQEHGPILLTEGLYEIRRQREYQPDGWVQVAD